MLEEVKQISNLDPVKTARIRILRAVVLAPHTVGRAGGDLRRPAMDGERARRRGPSGARPRG